MRFMSLLIIVLLAACSSTDDERPEVIQQSDEAIVIEKIIDFDQPDQAQMSNVANADPLQEPNVDTVNPYENNASYPATMPKKSYYPLMQGYRVDKSVEVFSLDDWYPPLPRQ